MRRLLVIIDRDAIRRRFTKWSFGFPSAILLILMVFLFSYNIVTFDQRIYNHSYQIGETYYFEIGYRLLILFFSKLGFNYQLFKCAMISVAFMLLYARLEKKNIAGNIFITLLLWLLSSFSFEAEQSRFLFGTLIILMSLPFLMEDGAQSMWKYLLGVCLAATIHKACLFYALFLIRKAGAKKGKILYPAIVLVLMVAVLGILNGNDFSFIGRIIGRFIQNERINLWFHFSTRAGFLGPVILQIATFVLIRYGIILCAGVVNEDERKMLSLCSDISLILFLALPFYQIATDFIRLQRGMYLFYFICVGIILRKLDIRYRILYVSAWFAFCLMFNVLTYKTIMPWMSSNYRPMYFM